MSLTAAMAGAAGVVLLAAGFAAGWHVQAGRVRVAQQQIDAARAVIKRQREGNVALSEALNRQHGAVATCIAASEAREKRGDVAIADARRYVDSMRPQIAALSAQIAAEQPGRTCEQALAEMRADLAR